MESKAAMEEWKDQFERDMIEVAKSQALNQGDLQTATWTTGNVREARAPVKRKALAPGSGGSAPSKASQAKATKSKRMTVNPDGAIAAQSCRKK